MEIVIEILFQILKAVIYIGIIGILIYLLLPWFFKKFVSPKFNASYVFKSSDFKKERLEIKLYEQEHIPYIEINKDNGIFNISFGEKRALVEGLIMIRHDKKIYTNRRSLDKTHNFLVLNSINEEKLTDNLGQHYLTTMSYKLDDNDNDEIIVVASIKQYINKNYLVFELDFPCGLKNTETGKYKELITAFPSIVNQSPNKSIFTYRNAIFCPPSRVLDATSAPVVFYDDKLNCFIISPLDGFLNTAISQDKKERINCGFQGEIKNVPMDFSQKFIIYFDKGINGPLERLGDILLKFQKSQKKDHYVDIAVSHLSYWTDNGAYYYYRTEKGMSYEETMVAVKDYFEKHEIPIKSYNFDSWWYIKYLSTSKKVLSTIFKPLYRILGGGLFGNTLRWEADPRNFSTDLKTFSNERFKYPIIAHSRRWDARSPYLEKFDFETFENDAVPLNSDFWEWCMRHAKESGIDIYEQDWLKNQTKSIPKLREDITAAEQWLNNMAVAARNNDISVLYCMQTPGMILYSMKHPNITIARCSGDYNHRWPLTFRFIQCTQVNILFHMVGINSHQDCFRTKKKRLGEKFPELKCLIEVLTAGLVAPSGKKEDVNWSLLRKTCRDDGLLLKPDKPITANDIMFTKHKKYYCSDTFTQRDEQFWRYVLIVNIWPKHVKDTLLSLNEAGYGQKDVIFYDYFNELMFKMEKDGSLKIGLLNKYEHKYYILAPIAKNGMSLIGCPDKFVCCSKKQFPNVSSTEDILTFSVEDIKGGNTRIIIYSEEKPSVIMMDDGTEIKEGGNENFWRYDSKLSKIMINLLFEENGIKTILVKK